VKRRYYFVLAAVAAAVGVYVYLHGWAPLGDLFSSGSGRVGAGAGNHWHTIERPGDGFKVSLPAEDKQLQVPAFNETGGSEPVHMLMASPAGGVTYAVSWQDNPPVARVSHSIERTLYMARDGMLTRTETSIISESRGNDGDYPSLDILASNSSGGILNARLIMAENRLYILFAMFPTASARREKDVNRFFDSFVPARPAGVPDSVPTGGQQ
jgi:hypothetical protein